VLDLERTSAEHPLADSPVSPNALIPEALETAQQVAVGGVRRHLSFHAARLRDSAGRILGAIETVQDNTERERIQQMLQHSQKMQALGTLAGGMAHEFNNILAATQGYAQLLGVHLKNQPDLGEYVREIEEGCTRAAGLVRRILTFSRMETRTGSLLDVNPVVADVVRILQEMFPPAIRLVADLQADLPLVMAEPIEMEQLLIHLGMNARDALPDGGEVRFSTRLFIPDDPFCRHQPWARSGRFLELVVEDTGTGIPVQVLPRIFDPFFTTKGPGRGTGLGLSIAHAIVHDHGGQILAESPVDERTGGGSRLRVFLPLAEKTVPTGLSKDPAQEGEPAPAAGSLADIAGGT
jgi:signal transduction histidine kinase